MVYSYSMRMVSKTIPPDLTDDHFVLTPSSIALRLHPSPLIPISFPIKSHFFFSNFSRTSFNSLSCHQLCFPQMTNLFVGECFGHHFALRTPHILDSLERLARERQYNRPRINELLLRRVVLPRDVVLF